MPWYVVGLIHTMESSGNFAAHLHNGDPLSARTTHVPAGRPKAGAPPFTWEESATDALTMQGFAKLEGLEHPGHPLQARGLQRLGLPRQPPGRELAVPLELLEPLHAREVRGRRDVLARPRSRAQCGAAVLLKRLAQLGAIAVADAEPRTLQLTNPYMTGPDVEEAQRLLADATRSGTSSPEIPTASTARSPPTAAQRAKLALGYPAREGQPHLRPAPPGLPRRVEAAAEGVRAAAGTKRLAAAPPDGEASIRKQIVEWALWGVDEHRPDRLQPGRNPPLGARHARLAPARDRLLRVRDPLLQLGEGAEPELRRPVRRSRGRLHRHDAGALQAQSREARRKPGDLVVWTPPSDRLPTSAILVTTGANPWLVSHGSDSGPLKIRFADEDAYQRRRGHGTAVFLSSF